jgi:hypothetical protein
MKKLVFPVLTIVLNLLVCFSAMAVATVDRINVTAEGAIPNDGGDDSAAINAAFDHGQSLYFPAGTYNYSGSMILMGTLANKSFRLYGDGPGVSTIIFTNAYAGGINAPAPTTGSRTLQVDGLTLQCGAACTTAIDATFTSDSVRTATIHNVQIIGNWLNGIHLNHASHSVLDKVEIVGGSTTANGIWLQSPDDQASTGFNMSNLQIKDCNTAFRTSGHVEGIYLTGFEFKACGRGAPAADLATLNGGGAFHLVNGTVETPGNGVFLTNPIFGKISNVRFVHTGPNNSTMLNISGGFNVNVSQCSFYGVDSTTVTVEHGIFVSNATSVQINGNNFSHMRALTGNCMNASGNCPALRITDNLFSMPFRNQYAISVSGTPAPYYCGNDPSSSNTCGSNP